MSDERQQYFPYHRSNWPLTREDSPLRRGLSVPPRLVSQYTPTVPIQAQPIAPNTSYGYGGPSVWDPPNPFASPPIHTHFTPFNPEPVNMLGSRAHLPPLTGGEPERLFWEHMGAAFAAHDNILDTRRLSAVVNDLSQPEIMSLQIKASRLTDTLHQVLGTRESGVTRAQGREREIEEKSRYNTIHAKLVSIEYWARRNAADTSRLRTEYSHSHQEALTDLSTKDAKIAEITEKYESLLESKTATEQDYETRLQSQEEELKQLKKKNERFHTSQSASSGGGASPVTLTPMGGAECSETTRTADDVEGSDRV